MDCKETIKKAMEELKIPIDKDGCVRCGKVIRIDYSGFCMDCADDMGISEMFANDVEKMKARIKKDIDVDWYTLTGKSWGKPPTFA